MKRITKLLSACLSSLLAISCSLSFNGENLPDHHNSYSSQNVSESYDGHSYCIYSINSFDGSVSASSDETGIHVHVTLDEDQKYTGLTLYIIENDKETWIESISPLHQFLYYMDVNGEIVPNGGSIIKGNETTGTETNIESSYRTNYLSSGTHTFDLPFVEAGKTYGFFVCACENEGYYKDVTKSTYGTIRTIDVKDAKSSSNLPYWFYYEGKILNHFTDIVKVTAVSDYKAPEINASYDEETGEYKFSKTDFSSYGSSFSSLSQDEISFKVSLNYRTAGSENQKTFTLDYDNSDEETTFNISEMLEDLDEEQYGNGLVLSQASLELTYQDHFEKKYEDCTTNEQLLDYYTSLYSLNAYSFSNSYTNYELPDNLSIPDKRMKLEVTATENGNVISFTMQDDASTIDFYNKSTGYNLGTMYGDFKAGTDYSFTDYLAEPGKTITYYAEWNERHSAYGTVTTLENTKHYPASGTSVFDEETMIYTVSENPLKNRVPENLTGLMEIDYGISNVKLEIDLDDAFTEKDFSSYSSWEAYSGKTLKIKTPVLIRFSGTVNDIYYTNTAKLNNTLSFVKSLKFKDNYVEPEDTGDDDDDSKNNDDDQDKEADKTGITVEDDLNLSSQETAEYIENYYRNNPSANVSVLDADDLPEIKKLTEADDGIEITIYIPEWLNNLEIERNDSESHYDSEKGYYVGTSTKSAVYAFDAEEFETGTVTVKDCCYVKDQEYEYELYFYAYGDPDSNYQGSGSSGKAIRQYSVDSLTNRTNCKHITPENSSVCYVQTCPAVTVSDGTISLENKSFGWNELPSDYKGMDSYENSLYSYALVSSGIKLNGKNDSSLSFDSYRKSSMYGNESVTYYCNEVNASDLYYEDEYGNKVEVSFTDAQLTRKYNRSTGDGWIINPYSTSGTMVKGSYKVTECRTGIYNDYGMWTYMLVTVSDDAVNSTFKVEAE